MICAISKKSEYLLAELIQQMIKTSGKYELDDVIKQVYERVKEQTKNEDTALAYAGLVPSLALKIFVYNPQLRKQFKVSMDKNILTKSSYSLMSSDISSSEYYEFSKNLDHLLLF